MKFNTDIRERALTRKHTRITKTLAVGLFVLASGSPWAAAGPVSATPGVFQGVIHFNAPIVADAVTVDARDVTNNYTAHANATQGGANCAPGTSDWCYQITVESALASNYYLRPIASLNKSVPLYVAGRFPFPPTAAIHINAGETKVVIPDISYMPGQVSGVIHATDLLNQPLQLRSVYFSMNDLSNTFAEDCGGSLEFCPFNSVFNSAVAPLPASASYQLFVKPASDYSFLTQNFSITEGPQAYSAVTFNSGEHLGSVSSGLNLVRNFTLSQVASVGGSIQLGQPFYNIEVDVSGKSTSGLDFSESYMTTNPLPGPPIGLTGSYVSRLFNNADLTQPFSLRPIFTLASDGHTVLAYPPTSFTLSPGQTQKTIDFAGTSATIHGRVSFDPPYPAGLIYPGVQAETQNASGGIGLAQTKLATDAQGGTYSLPAFGANWDYWRFGWNFDLGNPAFTSSYFIGQFLTISVPVADGQTVQKDFNFDTAFLKVYFTPPPGTTISAPQLNAGAGKFVNSIFTIDGDIAHAEGLNQNQVMTGETRMVLRVHDNSSFRITPSAVINANGPGTSRTDFSPFVITPKKGDVTIVGIPGMLSLTVSSPQDGQVFQGCQIPVVGTATGTQQIAITVNGHSVPTTSANNPSDPNQVMFTTMVAGQGGPTAVTITASAPNNSPITDVIHVTAAKATVAVNASIATALLWPPNHDLVNVGLAASAASACDANLNLGVKVFSNEGDTEETGSGNFSPDAKDIAPGTLRLRSERKGDGDGRVYLIVTTGTDHSNDVGYSCTAVVVPNSHSPASIASVNVQASTAVQSCQTNGAPPTGYVQVGTGLVIGPKQ